MAFIIWERFFKKEKDLYCCISFYYTFFEWGQLLLKLVIVTRDANGKDNYYIVNHIFRCGNYKN